MIKEGNKRIFITLSHDDLETLEILALENECTKSDVLIKLVRQSAGTGKTLTEQDHKNIISVIRTKVLTKIEEIASCNKPDCQNSCIECSYKKVNKVFQPYIK